VNNLSTTAELIAYIESNGFFLVRTKGFHRMYKNEKSGAILTLPVKKKELPNGLIKAIIKLVEISNMKE